MMPPFPSYTIDSAPAAYHVVHTPYEAFMKGNEWMKPTDASATSATA